MGPGPRHPDWLKLFVPFHLKIEFPQGLLSPGLFPVYLDRLRRLRCTDTLSSSPLLLPQTFLFTVRRSPPASVGTADRQAHHQGAREHGAGDCMVQASFVFFPLKSFVFPNRIRQSWSGLCNGGLWYVSTGWAAVRVQSGVALGTLPGQLFPVPHLQISSVTEGRKGESGLGSGPNRKRGVRGTRWRCQVWLPRAGAFKNPVSSQSPGRVQGHGASGSGTAGVLWWPRVVPLATSRVRVVSGSLS